MIVKKYHRSIFIFRRDLRIDDNTALIAALNQSNQVIPIFIFDTRQISNKNYYKSDNALQFMVESLDDLNKQLKKKNAKLYFFKGTAENIVAKITTHITIDALFINKDYTPFSAKRDHAISILCKKNKIDFIACNDVLLNDPETIHTKSGTPFAVFTPFFKKSRTIAVAKPKKCTYRNFYTQSIKGSNSKYLNDYHTYHNASIWVTGGTQQAQKLIKKIKNLKNYRKTRDLPTIETSNLSAHNKFGTISIRQLYHAIASILGKSSELITQLYWRDFFYHVAYHSPFVFGHTYHKKYDKLWWSKSKKDFERWCTGTTGFPIVDAGMRQLNETGYMHNRVRMIVASFLTKDLHINWLWGEKYFAQKLVDYDPCVNNGSWQWAASTGCDAQPYFRIFNPWLQQKKFDPECIYIKKWIPELKNINSKIIHRWHREDSPVIKNYPQPIVDHKKESMRAKQLYKKI